MLRRSNFNVNIYNYNNVINIDFSFQAMLNLYCNCKVFKGL